jgi:hypothetical protein
MAVATMIKVTPDAIIAYPVDGCVLTVPLAWSCRLSEATPRQRARFKLIGDGQEVAGLTTSPSRTELLPSAHTRRLLPHDFLHSLHNIGRLINNFLR